MFKQIYYEDENFVLAYEIKNGMIAVHCDVSNFKLSALRKGYEVFANFLNFASAKGFKIVCTLTPNPKFAKLLGGESVGKFTHEEKEYEVVIWELK